MTLRLILMRHAKSAWSDPTMDDFDRPLSARGQKAAQAMGRWLNSNNFVPDFVLCSAANRTKETLSRITPALSLPVKTKFLKSLYLASPETMLVKLTQIKTATTVLMLAHNPGCAMLATQLASRAPAHPRFADYPSAATCVLDFDVEDWALILPGMGKVMDFTVPRDLDPA